MKGNGETKRFRHTQTVNLKEKEEWLMSGGEKKSEDQILEN